VAAEGGAAGSAANEEPHDHDILLACASSGCPSSFAQLTDDTSLLVNAGPSACLLEALRDRTPGIYQHNVASNSARGAESTEHVFLVRSDGTVAHTTKLTQTGGTFAANGTSGISYTDAEYCELASPTYFADCLASLQDDDLAPEALAWACLYVDVDTTWLPHCDAGSPSCDG
jgi:hypothetical protein